MDAFQRRVVVVADPYANHQVARVADEQRVAIILRGAGLAEARHRQLGGAAGALVHGAGEQLLDLVMLGGRQAVPFGEQPAEPALFRREGPRAHREAVAGHAGVSAGQLEQRHRRSAERQAGIAMRQRRSDAELLRLFDHCIVADPLQQPHRGDVARTGEGIFQRDLVRVVSAGVLRPVRALHELAVVDCRVRRHSLLERREIDEQLEGGARLAPRLRGAVERRLRVILAPDHGDDLTVRMHRHQRYLRLAERSAPDHPTGDALQARIQRGPQRLARITDVAELPRLRQSPVGEVGPGRQVVGRAHVELRRRDRPRLRRRHVTGGHFRPQHCAHPPARQIEVLGRVVARRRLQQPGQHRRLPRREVLRLAVEVMQRGGAQTVSVVPEIGVRQVALENLVLGQPGFEPEGDQRFARLAAKRLLRRKERKLGELLGDRAATFGASAGQIAPRSASDPARIDSPMVIEAPVLDGDEGVDDVRRQLGDLHRLVDDRSGARDRRAVGSEQRDLRRRDRLERFRQRRGDRQPQHGEHE